VKYVSHLDTIQVFSRAIRRAGLPAVYSQGFNPQIQLVFGVPAPVGMTSTAEIMDLPLETAISCQELMERLNASLPEGYRIEKCIHRDTSKNIMVLTRASEYLVKIRANKGPEDVKKAVAAIMASSKFIVPKRSKSGVKDVNIRDMIFEAAVNPDGSLNMLLLSGNQGGLKPELFIEALNRMDPDLNARLQSVHRQGMYIEGEGGLIDPFTKELRWSAG